MRPIIGMLAVCIVATVASGCFTIQLGDSSKPHGFASGQMDIRDCIAPPPTFEIVRLTLPIFTANATPGSDSTLAAATATP